MRTLLFVAGFAFALSAVAGAAMLRWSPGGASIGSIVLATVFSALCLHLAVAAGPRAIDACGHCGRAREHGLSFCARCGAA